MVDHINHNTLDNRRINLKPASRSENGINRFGPSANGSGHLGAYFFHASKKWQARVIFRGTSYYFGFYPTAELAEQAAAAGRVRLMAGEVIEKVMYCGKIPQRGTIAI